MLQTLDPARARQLESLVRDALTHMQLAVKDDSGWPVGYFEQTAGALAGEEFERADQGELPNRDD